MCTELSDIIVISVCTDKYLSSEICHMASDSGAALAVAVYIFTVRIIVLITQTLISRCHACGTQPSRPGIAFIMKG